MQKICLQINLLLFQSIYGDDLTDLRKKTRKWIPLHLSITLLPLQGSCGLQVHAKVDLHIICTENYPNVYVNYIQILQHFYSIT